MAETNEQVVPLVPFPELPELLNKAQDYLPKMKAGSEAASIELQNWISGGELIDDEERGFLNDLLVNVRSSGEKMKQMRFELSRPLDAIKASLMQYEKPLGDEQKDSLYNQARAMITRFDQKKVDEKKRIEEQAAAKKAQEQKLIDMKASVQKAFVTKLAELVLLADKGSAEFLIGNKTLAKFDEKVVTYNKWIPKMKPEEWLSCFVSVDKKWLDADPNNLTWLNALKEEESIDKWNRILKEQCLPVMNEWKGKIPQLREDLNKQINAANETERKRLEDEQAAKEEKDTERRHTEIQQQAVAASHEVDQQANLDKLESNFKEQATVQSAEDTGPVTLILRFEDEKLKLKALTEIIYQCMAHKDFPGFDKVVKGKKVLDIQGRPQYIDAVQWWVDFFMKKCDAAITGTKVYEYSKTIVKK